MSCATPSTLRPDTVLIGLHPGATQIDPARRHPRLPGRRHAQALLETPKGGTNIVIGIGLYTSGNNPRAVAAIWKAGTDSMMNDVRFLGGHGTPKPDGSRENPYNNTHTADPDLNRRWDSQYPSLWVTDGGGGTFLDLWTPTTFAQAGMLVSDTDTEGRVYQMSSEHHVRYEVQFRNAANWQFYALQTEEERGEGGFALPLEIDGLQQHHLRQLPHLPRHQLLPALPVGHQGFRLEGHPLPQRPLLQQQQSLLRRRRLRPDPRRRTPPARVRLARPLRRSRPSASLNRHRRSSRRRQGGEARRRLLQHLRRRRRARQATSTSWTPTGSASTAGPPPPANSPPSAILPLDPVNLAFDKAGNLMVVSYSGNGVVYAFKPGAAADEFAILPPAAAAPRPGLTAVRSVGDWRIALDPATGLPVPKAHHYLSPDGTTFLAAGSDFTSGALSWGTKSADVLRGFGLAAAVPGKPFYITSEADVATWTGALGPDGNFTSFKPFVQQGGEGIAVDPEGNVYLAAGQIYVYSPGRPPDRYHPNARTAHPACLRRKRRTHPVHRRAHFALQRANSACFVKLKTIFAL